jgi:hypothetical protein
MRVVWKIAFILAMTLETTACKNVPAPGGSVAAPEDVRVTDEYIPDDGGGTADKAGYDEVYGDVKTPSGADDIPASAFGEVWAYLISGREADLKSGYAISDIVYFAAEVDRYGHLADVPRRGNIVRFNGRVHLALVCNSAGLTHFVIQGGSEARKQLISEIFDAVKDYDGLNVDMENVPARDADTFLSFLSELRAGLGNKMLSVCVPGRIRADPTYNYTAIAALAGRVFVMAYDEHWSGSSPGPVASMNWCRAVAVYGLNAIGREKLIMGIPFYGRSWGDKTTSRALIHSTTEKLKSDYEAQNIRREDGIPTFTYEVTVKVTVYYEDTYSLAARMNMYRERGVQKIGFWRLGQEAPDVWEKVKLDK